MVRPDLCEQLLRKRLLQRNESCIENKINRFQRAHGMKVKKKGKRCCRPSSTTRGATSSKLLDSSSLGSQLHHPLSNREKQQNRHYGSSSKTIDKYPRTGTTPPVRKRAASPSTAVGPSLFPKRYLRRELPCTIQHHVGGLALSWQCGLHDLDYDLYLPIFMDGIRCTKNPFNFIARQGVHELVEAAKGRAHVIRRVLHKLIKPMRLAFQSKHEQNVLAVITIVKHMISTHTSLLGPYLVPYYRQILFAPVLNVILSRGGKNLGDAIDYSQFKNKDLCVEILSMLELLERYGGKDSFVNIKVMIPTYESCCDRSGRYH